MPTSVKELFDQANLSFNGPVKWGQIIPAKEPGVYVVSLSETADDKVYCLLEKAPIETKMVKQWIEYVPNLKIDKIRPIVQDFVKRLSERLSEFWLPDETILYIGNTSSISNRVNQYYETVLGDPRPHRGGHWIKTLKILEELYIYWAITNKYKDDKIRLLKIFKNNVSDKSKENLYDPFLSLPFANLEFTKRRIKDHGLSGQAN